MLKEEVCSNFNVIERDFCNAVKCNGLLGLSFIVPWLVEVKEFLPGDASGQLASNSLLLAKKYPANPLDDCTEMIS